MPLTMNETQTVTVWTLLVLVIALLFLAGGAGCASGPVLESDVAVALPPDWEFRLGVSVADTPQMRPGYFAVSKEWLKEQM